MAGPTEIETDRLTLRRWRDADPEPFAGMNADARVMAHFPHPLTRDAIDAGVQRWRAPIDQRGCGLWAAKLRASSEFLGFIGLQIPTAPLPFSPCVEVIWRLAQAH